MLLLLFLIIQDTAQIRAWQTPPDTSEIITYYGKKIIYYPPEEKVFLLGSAWVKYQDYRIFSDTIVYNLRTNILSAYKEVNFISRTESIYGKEFHYNIHTRRGVMKKAKTRTADGFLNADCLYLIKEKTLLAENCYYTTCNHTPPHYYFYGKRLKILLDDMAITQPILLELQRLPVAAAPFWFFPIATKRKSGLLPFKVGRSSVEGYYARGISYYLVINDYSDLTFYLDVMQKKGLRPKIEGVYLVNPFASGNLLLTYIDEWDTKKKLFSINAKHSSRFLFETDLGAYIDYQNDARYLPEYSEERIEWLKQEIVSEVGLSRRIKNFGRTAFTFRHYHDFPRQITTMLMPSVSFNLYQRPIFKNFGISPSISYSREEWKDRDTLGQDSLRRREERVSASLGLYLPPLPFTSIGLVNSFSAGRRREEVVMPRTARRSNYLLMNNGISLSHPLPEGIYLSENFSYNHRLNFERDSVFPVVNYNFSLNSGLNLYRPFYLSFFTLNGILHQVSPSVFYNFQPEIKIKGIWGFPRFDTLPLSHNIGINIGNTFQGKFGKEEFISNIGSVNLNLSYNLISKNLTPLNVSFEFILLNQPNASSQIFLSFNCPIETLRPKDLSISSSFSYQLSQFPFFLRWLPADTLERKTPISFTLNHIYSPPVNNMLLYSFSFALKGWSFSMSGGYNFQETKRKITDYTINIWKDLHCWEAIIFFSGLGTNWRYDFKIRIKKIPDVSIGKGILEFLLP